MSQSANSNAAFARGPRHGVLKEEINHGEHRDHRGKETHFLLYLCVLCVLCGKK